MDFFFGLSLGLGLWPLAWFKLLAFLDERYQAREEPEPERAPAVGFVAQGWGEDEDEWEEGRR